MQQIDDFFGQMQKAQAEAEQVFGGGGSGIVANTTISTGYKVFARGASQEETWFPYPLGDKDAEAKAATLAKAFATEQGAVQMINGEASNRLNVHFGLTIIARRDGAFSGGQEAQWKGDRHFFCTFPKGWYKAEDPNAFRDLVMPSLQNNGITKFPWAGWTRIGFKADPYKVAQGDNGKTDTGQDGTPRFPMVAYIVAVFENETAAKSSADEPVVASGDVSEDDLEKAVGKPGPDWTWADLMSSVEAIKEEQEGGQAVPAIATNYGLEPVAVLFALGAHSETGAPPMVAKRFGVTPADIAAVKELAKGLTSLSQ